jgi:hypothetical protein
LKSLVIEFNENLNELLSNTKNVKNFSILSGSFQFSIIHYFQENSIKKHE